MLKTRIVTALLLVTGCLGVLFWLPTTKAALAFGLVAVVAAWEWSGLIKSRSFARAAFVATTGLSCLGLFYWPGGLLPLWLVAVVFWLGLMPFWLRMRWPLAGGPLGYLVGLVVIVPTWAAMVMLHGHDPMLLLLSMALVWVADIAAYAAGRLWGRHKLAVHISPGKTWEGAIGAAVAVVIFVFAVAYAYRPADGSIEPSLVWIPLLVLVTAVSIVGDLFESLIKRQAGVKDSSNLLPGHGGVLDRIDSLTSTLPVLACALALATP
jgi:phosphatidate cytidylyltransferase